MATKLPRDGEPVAPAPATPAASDNDAAGLDVMAPDITDTIAGREVTFREYGFMEGLAVAERASGLIADMTAQCKGGALRYAHVRRLFGKHRDVVVEIAAQSAGVESAWVAGLKESDGERFLALWFSVNSGFFVREVVVELREASLAAGGATSTGSGSSPGSPARASATTTGSSGSPSVN